MCLIFHNCNFQIYKLKQTLVETYLVEITIDMVVNLTNSYNQ